MRISTRAWIKALAGLSINISAAWFGVAIITPNFANLQDIESLFTLTRDLILGIIFLLITVLLEQLLEKYDQ